MTLPAPDTVASPADELDEVLIEDTELSVPDAAAPIVSVHQPSS